MCDYSLHAVQNRPAKVGDKLVVTKFPNSITTGLSAVGEPGMAVCLLPGTEVAFEKSLQLVGKSLQLAGTKLMLKRKAQLAGHKTARFRKINEEDPLAHHDALELPDGGTVLINQLDPGQRCTVLQLPVNSDGKPVKGEGAGFGAPAREPTFG